MKKGVAYSHEEKIAILQEHTEHHRTLKEICEEYGISKSYLCYLLKQYRENGKRGIAATKYYSEEFKLGVVKRLHAKTVPGEKQALFLSVPDGERPHSVKAVHAFFLPLAVRRHDHFRVAVSAERVPLMLQFLPDLDKIVYLTVKRHPVALIGVGHRLASGTGEI